MNFFKAINDVSLDGCDPEATSQAISNTLKGTLKVEERNQKVDVEQLFRSALTSQSEGPDGENNARTVFMQVLQSEDMLSKDLSTKYTNIKFACLKNLMIMHERQGQLNDAIRFGLQAVEIDSEDISLLHRLGRIATASMDFDLALQTYRRVLELRPGHWPVLDASVRLTYGMTRFEECLNYCYKALEKDRQYRPAFYCIKTILEMQPFLHKIIKSNITELLTDSILNQAVFHDAKFCKSMENFAEEVRSELRRQLEASQEPPRPVVIFEKHERELKWSTLTNAIFEKYYALLQDEKLFLSVDLKSLLPSERQEDVKTEDVEMVESDIVNTNGNTPSTEEAVNEEETAVGAPKVVSPIAVISKIARSTNFNETLVEKRRSSRVCVTSAWGANEESEIKREKSNRNGDSTIYLLNDLLFEDIRDWADEDREKDEEANQTGGHNDMDITENSQESSLGHVDDESNTEITNFIKDSDSKSLMYHARDLLLILSRKYDKRWPRVMLRQYSSLFESVFGLNFQHGTNVPEEQRMDYIQAYLFALELQADKMQTDLESVDRQLQPKEEPYPKFPHLLMVHQWMIQMPQESLFYKQCIIRIRWLDFIWQYLLNDQLMAESTLEEIRRCLNESINELRRPNCNHAPLIDNAMIETHRNGLTKCVGIAQLRSLAAKRRYSDVIDAWKNDSDKKSGDLTPARCDIRTLVHRAFAHTENWKKGFFHGLSSMDGISLLLQDPSRLADSPLDGKAFTKFARRSLHLTAICWGQMSDEDQSQCRRSDSARLVVACCLLIQNCVNNDKHVVAEEVWLMLFDHLMKLENDNHQIRRSTTADRPDEMDLAPSIMSLYIGHEYLASKNSCTISDGRFLRKIINVIGSLRKRVHDRYYGHVDDLEKVFAQALSCLHGVIKKSKTRTVDDHFTEKSPIRDYTTMQTVYQYLRPEVIPEYDSVRSLTIGAEVVTVLKGIVQDLGQYENKFGIDEETLDILVTRDSQYFDEFSQRWMENGGEEDANNIPECILSKEIYYLLADFYFKSRSLEEAAEYYRYDLRFNPMRFDSWAALSLTRLSLIQKSLDQQDYTIMENAIDGVNLCMHGFECALKLNTKCSKLMVENGTLCYEIFSYSDKYYRQWQLRGSCSSEVLLRACCHWRRNMLSVAERRFSEAMACGADDENELWYYSYMKGKCGEKSGRCLWTEVMPQYRKALQSLHKMGAKYPRRVFFYGAAPAYSLEAIEVFYRCHATIIKRLLRYASEPEVCPDLDLIEKELHELKGCEFALTERVKAGQKRGRQKGSASCTVVNHPTSASHRRSKRRFEAGESCTTSEAEPELEGASFEQLATGPDDGADEAACQIMSLVLTEVDRHIDVRDCLDDVLLKTVATIGDLPPSEEERKTRQWERCVNLCLGAFELLTQRIPHHYKAVRKVALIFFGCHNTTRALEYLWTGGTLEGAKFPICALFKDRKENNLFYGIYRNPIHDLDRCGNFSHHMRGCVDLLLRALREQCDWVGLKDVYLSLLHSIPEVKNVCITESELLIFQRRAFALCIQSVDELLQDSDSCRLPPQAEGCLCALHKEESTSETRRMAVYKLWRLHRQAVRSFPPLKKDSFRCVARAFFLAKVKVSKGTPIIQQIRNYLKLSNGK